MRNALALLLLLSVCWFSGQGAPFLYAQEEDENPYFYESIPAEEENDPDYVESIPIEAEEYPGYDENTPSEAEEYPDYVESIPIEVEEYPGYDESTPSEDDWSWDWDLYSELYSEGDTYVQEEYEEDEEDDPYYNEDIFGEEDWGGYIAELYSRGDQTFTISLGLIFPAIFTNNGQRIDHHFSPPVGGTGTLVYTYFFTSNIFFGAEIGVKFNRTLARNTIFLIPIGARAGWQFVFRRFEFPLFGTIGFAPQRYLNLSLVGLFTKLGAGAYYRFNPDWSFGLNVDWNWYPQRPKGEKSKNVNANIIGVTISARYHF